jgi:hypothetical protein
MSRFLSNLAIRRSVRTDSADTVAGAHLPLDQQTGDSGRGRSSGRPLKLAIALAASAGALAVGLGTASAAQAQVNPDGPHFVFSWGDCQVDLGNVKTSNGAAVGGADITCDHYHDRITAWVELYRYNGSGWDLVSSGGGSDDNDYGLYAWTDEPVCGNWTSYWDDVVTVDVDGAQRTFDLFDGLGYAAQYAPPC